MRFRSWLVLLAVACPLTAATIWDESVNGDLSSFSTSPTQVILGTGLNTVIGSVGTPDSIDGIWFTVSPGFQVTSIVLDAYVAVAPNEMSGFNFFSGSSGTGGTGIGLVNAGPANIGQDLLSLIPLGPLGAADYSLLIAEGSSAGNTYQFTLNLTAVPEPSTLLMMGIGLLGVGYFTRRKSKRS